MQQPAVMRVLERLASLRLTLVILAALLAAVVYAYHHPGETTGVLVPPLLLFAANLGAAVATNPVFRRQTALLVFHLALIALILLVATGRLMYLKGRAEVAEGVPFDGTLVEQEAGPLHRWRLDRAGFENLGFRIEYDVGRQRGRTENRVAWRDDAGAVRTGVIGDHTPLVLAGYRFYTTPNKGFAPFFTWIPRGGEAVRGAVHLPSFPMREYEQAGEWTLPGSGERVWAMLQFDEVLIDPAKPSEFKLPERYRMVVRVGEERRELAPGGRVELPGGVLVYEGLGTWMGYQVFSDWTIPWLLASSVLAAGALGRHFWSKFGATPWLGKDEGNRAA